MFSCFFTSFHEAKIHMENMRKIGSEIKHYQKSRVQHVICWGVIFHKDNLGKYSIIFDVNYWPKYSRGKICVKLS